MRSIGKYFLSLLLPALLSGCFGTKHLKKNEKLLFRQSIKGARHIDQEQLRALYAQEPNRRFLKLPVYHLAAIYYAGARRYNQQKFIAKRDSAVKKFDEKIAKTRSEKKIANLQFRKQKKIDKYNSRIENGNLFMQWGEPISVFDSSKVELTIQRFKDYLFSEGYFRNRVHAKITSIGRFVNVSYQIEPGQPYIVDTIFYSIPDSAVLNLILENQRQSLIREGDRYREENFAGERERIDFILRDHGYYDFSRQYIEFSVDTIRKKNRVAIMLSIFAPAKRGYHKRFSIDSVLFTTDAGVSRPGKSRESKKYRDILYHYFENQYNLKILSQRILLSPDSLYSRNNTLNTQRQLNNLDAFKFVNINYDTTGGKFIAHIIASPLDRYEWSNEMGVNVTGGYPGPFYNINFKKRNIFKGLENFELNGRIGIEGVASATKEQNIYRSTEAGVNASLVFPQFIWPFREKTQINLGRYNPKTRLSLGYSYTDRPDEYRRISTSISNNYTWQSQHSNQSVTQYSLALTNISLIHSETTPPFDSLLTRLNNLGNFSLVNSFKPSFVSSMIFGVTWNRNYGSQDKNSVFVRAQVETGGTSLNFINPEIVTQRGLQYFQYLRFNLDFRKVNILNKWASLAYRINTGVGYSYSPNKTLPYEKFFFAGGSNSVRAWRPRRLGPGSEPPSISRNPEADGMFDYQFEKPGEILLEGSVELRSKLVGFIDGAVFIDAGNVWSFRQGTLADPTENPEQRGNAQFRPNSFYKELGIGTGFGLRFDFTFLILRFDVGIKVYDPARQEGDRFVLDKARFFKPFSNSREPVIYNIGIGYPF